MSDRLHDDLDYLAQQVTVVDLRDRALRTSRRRTRRKAILASLTVVAVLAGAGVVAWAAADRRSDIVPVGPTPSATASPTPSPSASASTSPAFAPLDPSATHLGPWTLKPGPSLPGQVFMFSHPYGEGPASISILAGGQLRTSSLGYLAATSCIANSYVFSPDGTHIAWVRGSLDIPGGQLVSTDLATRASVVIADGVSCRGAHSPKWSADSRSIIYNRLEGGAEIPRQTSLDTGQTTLLPGGQGAFEGATTKNFRAYGATNGEIVVVDPNNNIVRKAYNSGGGGLTWLVIGLSEDGRYVTLRPRLNDPYRQAQGKIVFDTVTNTDVTPSVPPASGIQYSIVHVILLPAGRMLVQMVRPDGSHYLDLLAADRTIVASAELDPTVFVEHYLA